MVAWYSGGKKMERTRDIFMNLFFMVLFLICFVCVVMFFDIIRDVYIQNTVYGGY